MKFYMGADKVQWLARVDIPLFISRRTLAKRKTFPRANVGWALDSGGFTEIGDLGRWAMTEPEYVAHIRRFADGIGKLEWAAPMDWMCEPIMLTKTGLDVAEHQRRTVANFLTLRTMAADLPIIPVVQGWTLDDYLRCVDLYDRAGVDLTAEPLIGVGSVCRRQATTEIMEILVRLHGLGLSMHGFGVKSLGLRRYAYTLTSADSFAWSMRGYNVAGCSPTHKNEANCLPFALAWRERMLAGAGLPQQSMMAL